MNNQEILLDIWAKFSEAVKFHLNYDGKTVKLTMKLTHIII